MFADMVSGFGYTVGMAKAIPWRDRVIPEPNSGCWLWEGYLTADGYGMFALKGKRRSVYRLAWEETHGPVPSGYLVLHRCGIRSCCNPEHLFLTPKGEAWQDRLIPEPNSGCWLWDGAVSVDGYGQLHRNGRTYVVHRLAWEETNGPIPKGLIVCHRCDVPACCNPDHLFLGTSLDNTRDMMAKGRFWARSHLNALKTHCPQGHEYTPDNTLTYRGMRTCRQCNKERSLARYYSVKAAGNA